MLLQPVCDGYPTQSPATGNTPAGSASSSASFSTWLRTTLMGQQPSPSAAAAVIKPCRASPASTAAFMNMSSVSLGNGRPRSSATRRMRRLSPQNSMKSGAVAIQGMSWNYTPAGAGFADPDRDAPPDTALGAGDEDDLACAPR